MQDFNASITVKANNQLESLEIINALQSLANNITPENLKVLASKSTRPDINAKIKQFKNFI